MEVEPVATTGVITMVLVVVVQQIFALLQGIYLRV
jgi:hypothetical protein